MRSTIPIIVGVLSALARLYGGVIAFRNYLYDKGIFEVRDLGIRTISVGNLTTGGTGKTPFVAHIASLLADRGEKVCILSRGYGRENENARVLVSDGRTVLVGAEVGGDEPVELAKKLVGKAIVISDADRIRAAEWASRVFEITVFILDDGFQHRKVKRDLDLVCVDATRPFSGADLIPAGELREPLSGLSRADVAVITRAEQVDDPTVLRSQILEIAPGIRIFEMLTRIDRLGPARGVPPGSPERLFAFCALGNPDGFFSMIRSERPELVGTKSFRDHHAYTQEDIRSLESEASRAGADALVTTAKDEVKLGPLRFSLPRYVAEISVELRGEGDFDTVVR